MTKIHVNSSRFFLKKKDEYAHESVTSLKNDQYTHESFKLIFLT